MKSVIRFPHIKAFAVISAIVLSSLVRVASGQERVLSQQVPVTTAISLRSSNVSTEGMSFDQVKSITQGSIREIVSEQLGGITATEIQQKLAGTFDRLASGQMVSFSANVSGLAAHSVTEQHTMQVNVKYEPRPIGGILTIKVELVPVFSGIGSASRPIALKTASMSVENLEEDALGGLVSDLTHQLGSDYAGR